MLFLLGNGMFLMMVIMHTHSQPIQIRCGGIGASTIRGDGVLLGIITVGMVRVIGMAVIGAGLIITTIIGILDIITIIIRTMLGVV